MNKKENFELRTKSLSANTLFHFTHSLDNLVSILKNDFYPRYSLEYHSNFFIKEKNRAIPMVSFCDIPLSQIINHANIYGCYAIGLTKEWGKQNCISPVIYVYKNSLISKMYEIIREEVIYSEELNISFAGRKAVTEIYRYLKPYEGELWRNGNIINQNVRFYDEREWRYVPTYDVLKQFKLGGAISMEKYLNKDFLLTANRKLQQCKLGFEPINIKYIIVEKESQLLEMYDKIIKIKRSKFSFEDVELLTTRIISMEQIVEDF